MSADRDEADRADAERADADRGDADRADAELADAELADAERADAERADAERADAERADAERADAERADADRADAERADADRADADRADAKDADAHAPKTAALLAYAEGVLSEAGQRRVEAHLRGCGICRRELAAIELYDGLSDEVRHSDAPAVDFDRMERTLAREAQRISTQMQTARRRPWGLMTALAAAAAALLALWLAWPGAEPQFAQPSEQPTEPTEPTEPTGPGGGTLPTSPADAEPARLEPVVTLAAGPAHRRAEDGVEALRPGDRLDEGDVLQTGEGGELHVRLRGGTGLLLRADAELTLARARVDAVRLELSRGQVAQQIAPLGAGSTYLVACAGHEVEVRGTRFSVRRVGAEEISVELQEGRVEVRTPDGRAVTLQAPARWRSGRAPAPRAGGAEVDPSPEGVAVAAPRGLGADVEGLTEVTLEHPELVRWEIDGTQVESGGPVRLWLPPGEHPVRGWTARERLFSGVLPVGRAPVALSEGVLSPEQPRLRPGRLEEAEISRVVQRGRRNLQRCYEVALRRGATIHGRIRLRVTVGVMGDVRRVSVLDLAPDGTDELRQCIQSYVGRWTFPPPGGPVSFEVPLALTSR